MFRHLEVGSNFDPADLCEIGERLRSLPLVLRPGLVVHAKIQRVSHDHGELSVLVPQGMPTEEDTITELADG